MNSNLQFMIILLTLGGLSSCGGGKGKLLLPDSSRWTDQDIPIEEVSTGNVNTDSLATLEEMRKIFSPADSVIEGKPASYYLQRRDVSQASKSFYLLQLQPAADSATFGMCDSLLTSNDTTRGFYYFLFLRLSRIDQLTLADAMAERGSGYALRFVDEFYKHLRTSQYNWSLPLWAGYVASSHSELGSAQDLRQYVIGQQMKNLSHANSKIRQEISDFADSVAKRY